MRSRSELASDRGAFFTGTTTSGAGGRRPRTAGGPGAARAVNKRSAAVLPRSRRSVKRIIDKPTGVVNDVRSSTR